MKKNRVLLVLVTLFFIFLSVLYYDMTPVYLMMSFGLPALLSLIYYLYLPKNIESRLVMASYYNKNANVHGEMFVKKERLLPVFYGRIFFNIENLLTGEVEEFFLDFSLFGKKEKKLKFDFRVKHAGLVNVSIQRIEIYSLLGCFKKGMEIKRVRSCMVLPDSFEMMIKLNPVYCMHEEGEKTVQSRNGYDSGIYYGVRDYREGDSMKNIHWKLTGKTDEYLVKELGMPALLYPVLYLETNIEEMNPDLIDIFIEVYVSLSLQMIENGYKHTLCWYDCNKEEWNWHTIEEMEHLEEVFTYLLKTPFTAGKKPHFFELSSDEWNQYGQIIIVSNQNGKYEDLAARPDSITLLYGREKKDDTINDMTIYPFGLNGYRKDLELLIV